MRLSNLPGNEVDNPKEKDDKPLSPTLVGPSLYRA